MIQHINFMEASTYITKFERALQRSGYKASTIRECKVCIKHFIRYSISQTNLFTFDSIEKFMSIYNKKTRASTYNYNRNSCVKFYYFIYYQDIHYKTKHISTTTLCDEFDNIFNQFIDNNKNNAPSTIKKKYKSVHNFLSWLECNNLHAIKTINSDNLVKYLEDKIIEERYYIKSFLYFLFINNYISTDLSFFIHIQHRETKLPTVYTQNEIEKLIHQIDINRDSGIRDKAIILLAASCGIRASDIVNLRFENIDFITHELNIVQVKTSIPLILILSDELLYLLKKYHDELRPLSNFQYLFLNQNAPYNPVSTSGVRYLVTKYLIKANINITNKKHGPHSLRSSLATAMVNSDVSYEIVQKTLGHKNLKSLKSYIKVDIEKLREYSLPSIIPFGTFRNWLEGDELL